MTELNVRQRRFAEAFVVSGDASKAATQAGYSSRTATSQGGRLLRHVLVAERISQLQTEAATRAEIDVDGVISMLLESYQDAKGDRQHGPAIRAVELLGKTLGAFKDKIEFAERGVTDDDLIEGLAGGDLRKAEMLRAIVGASDTFDA